MEQNKNNVLLNEAKNYIAGSIAGIVGAIIGQPFDTIKVRLQASTTGESMTSVIQNLVKNEGVMALYKGVASPVVAASAIESIRFGVFEYARRNMGQAYRSFNNMASNAHLDDRASIIVTCLSGSVAGIFASVVMGPTEHIRIRMQMQKTASSKYSNSLQCFQYINKTYGMKGIFKGTAACALRDAIGANAYFGSYEAALRFIKHRLINEQKQSKQEQKNKERISQMMAGGISGIGLWASIYPIDTIKSIIQSDKIGQPKYNSFMHVFRSLSTKQLFQGFLPCMLRSVPCNAGVFLTFEYVKNVIDNTYGLSSEF